MANALFESLLVGGLLWGLLFSVWVGIRIVRGDELVAYEPRHPVPWRFLDVLIAGSLWIALQGGAAFAMQKALDLPSGEEAKAARLEVLAPLLAADSVAKLLALVLAVAWLKVAVGATWRDLGLDLRRPGYDMRIGAAAFGAVLVPVYAIQAILTQWYEYDHPVMEMMKSGHNVLVYLMAFGAAVVVAPIVEEFLFRVLLQGWLEAYWLRTTPVRSKVVPTEVIASDIVLTEIEAGGGQPDLPSRAPPMPRPSAAPIILSALVFALMHVGLGPSPIPLFVLALVLGYLYRQTHRIWPSMVLHALLNGCSLLMVLLGGG